MPVLTLVILLLAVKFLLNANRKNKPSMLSLDLFSTTWEASMQRAITIWFKSLFFIVIKMVLQSPIKKKVTNQMTLWLNKTSFWVILNSIANRNSIFIGKGFAEWKDLRVKTACQEVDTHIKVILISDQNQMNLIARNKENRIMKLSINTLKYTNNIACILHRPLTENRRVFRFSRWGPC